MPSKSRTLKSASCNSSIRNVGVPVENQKLCLSPETAIFLQSFTVYGFRKRNLLPPKTVLNVIRFR